MITTTSNASDRPNKAPSNITEVLDVLVDLDSLLLSIVEAVVVVTLLCCMKFETITVTVEVVCMQDEEMMVIGLQFVVCGVTVAGVFVIVVVGEIHGSCNMR